MCKYFERLKFQALTEAITMSSKFSTIARMAHGFPCLSPQGRTASGMAVNRVCFTVRIPSNLGINIFGIAEFQDFLGFQDQKPHSLGFPCLLDVLWGQPIKLIQVVFTSGFHEYYQIKVVVFSLSPWVSAGTQQLQTLAASKTKVEKSGSKI